MARASRFAHALGAAVTALAMSASTVHASVVWDCFTDDRKAYIADTYVRDVSVYWTIDTLFFAHCTRGQMLRVTELGEIEFDGWAKDITRVHRILLNRFIAARDTYTFGDVSRYLTDLGYTVTFEPVVKDDCLCELES